MEIVADRFRLPQVLICNWAGMVSAHRRNQRCLQASQGECRDDTVIWLFSKQGEKPSEEGQPMGGQFLEHGCGQGESPHARQDTLGGNAQNQQA